MDMSDLLKMTLLGKDNRESQLVMKPLPKFRRYGLVSNLYPACILANTHLWCCKGEADGQLPSGDQMCSWALFSPVVTWPLSLQLPFWKTSNHPVLGMKSALTMVYPKDAGACIAHSRVTYMGSFDQQNVSKGPHLGWQRRTVWVTGSCLAATELFVDKPSSQGLGPYKENRPVSHASSTLFCFCSIHCRTTSTFVEPLSLSFCNIGYYGCRESSFPREMDVKEV